MRKKILGLCLCAGLSVATVSGVGQIQSFASTTVEETQEEGARPMKEQQGTMAKVTEVGDDSLTVILAQRPERPEGETLAEGETPPAKPEGETLVEGETPPAKPEGETLAEGETPPARPEGETEGQGGRGGRGQGGMAMDFTGDAAQITLTSDTVYTRGMGQEEASLSDVEADSVVRLVLDGTTAVSVEIMEVPETAEAF